MKNGQEDGALGGGVKCNLKKKMLDHSHGSPKFSFLLVNIPPYFWLPNNVLINKVYYFVGHPLISTSFSASCDSYRYS